MNENFEALKTVTLTDDDMFIVQDKETGFKQQVTKAALEAAIGGGGSGGGGAESLVVGPMRIVEDVAGAFQNNLWFDITAPTTPYDPLHDDLIIEVELNFGVNNNAGVDGPNIVHFAALTDFAANSIAEDNLYNTENWASRLMGHGKAHGVGTAPVLNNGRFTDQSSVKYPLNNGVETTQWVMRIMNLRPMLGSSNDGDNNFVGDVYIFCNSTGQAVHFGYNYIGTCMLEGGNGVADPYIIPDKLGLMLYDDSEPVTPSTLVGLTGVAHFEILRDAR